MSVDIQHCMRVFGGSCRDCACMLPLEGGWTECPQEARGIIPPRMSKHRREYLGVYAGEFCHSCGSPNMIRTGTCMTCGDCGDSSGGCS